MRVATANLYRKNAHRDEDTARLLAIGADYIGTQEDWLDALPGYVEHGSTEKRHAREVAGWLREDHPYRGEAAFQASESTGEDIREHARWMVVTLTEVDLPVGFVNTHLNAGQFDRGELADDAGGDEYRAHVKRLVATCQWVLELGYTPVMTMDANDFHGDAYWSPERALKRIGLTYEQRGIDGIAYDAAVWRVAAKDVVRPKGADHKWLVLDLEPRRR